MAVSLIEDPSGTAATDSTASQQSAPSGASTAPGGRRDLVTLHVGEEWTIAQEDLELLLLVVQTLLLVAWAYTEITDS
jgi:hypothetical protein